MIVSDGDVRTAVLAAARDLAVMHGWPQVRMGQIADRALVSRQTVHNTFGTKQQLGAELAAAETTAFARHVSDLLNTHPGTTLEAVAAAVGWALRQAKENRLIAAILAPSAGHPDPLIYHLTTQAGPAIAALSGIVAHWAHTRHPAIPVATISAAAEGAVRLTLSHLIYPGEGQDTPAGIAAAFGAMSGISAVSDKP